jgi:nucleotidyltransferase-like protein
MAVSQSSGSRGASSVLTWQQMLDDALDALKGALGNNLLSVVLYGSAARGDFVPGVSDLNLLIILNESSPQAHESLASVLRGRPNVEPFTIGRSGLLRTARAFPAKFAAIRRTGRAVFGPDLLVDVARFPDLERFAAEQALRNVRLRLVYNFIKRGGDPSTYTRFALNFVPAVYSACNGVLELEGQTIPRSREEQAALYASAFEVDSGVLVELLQLKRKPRPLSAAQVSSTHARLFAVVMAALAWVEKRWPT